MTSYTLKIPIECGATTCASEPGKWCVYIGSRKMGTVRVCTLFPSAVEPYTDLAEADGWIQRCPDCLALGVAAVVAPAPVPKGPPTGRAISGYARAAAMTADQRREASRHAATALWAGMSPEDRTARTAKMRACRRIKTSVG